MRISDEIDALEVMGIDSMVFLCATRLLAAWLVLPFMYIAAVGAGFFACYLAVVQQIGEVSLRRVLPDLLDVPEPARPLVQRDQGMAMATVIVLVGCYYGYNASGGPVGVGHGDREVDGAEHRARAPHRDARHPDLLGREPARPDRRMSMDRDDERFERPGRRRRRARTRFAREDARRGARDPRDGGRPRARATVRRSRVSVVRERATARTTSTSGTPALQRPTGAADAVEFIDVHKAFGRNKILRGLNMGLPEGKISMILGPSGTGKSVCIKHMVGLLYPDEGDVLVHGESVPNMADDELFEMRKKFGVLFQDGALFGSMNLFDNVAFPLRQHTDKGEDEIGEIVNRRLREVGLARRRRQDAQRALGRHAQARRLRARARARPRHRALRRARLGPRPGPHRAAVRADPGDPRGERRRLRRDHPRHHDARAAWPSTSRSCGRAGSSSRAPPRSSSTPTTPFVRQFLSGESQGPLGME